MMKKLASVVGITVFTIVLCAALLDPGIKAQSPDASKDPVKIDITVLTPVIHPGEQVRMKIVLRDVRIPNFQMQRVYREGGDGAYAYEVQTISGDKPRVDRKPGLIEFAGGPTLNPGESAGDDDVGLIGYIFAGSGQYRVRAYREMPKEFGGVIVYSNWATFSVSLPG